MLNEVDLLVGGRDPEVVADDLEVVVELGDPISAGQTIARVHEPRRLGVEPTDYHATIDGLLAMRHHPGLVKMGDAIAMQAYLA